MSLRIATNVESLVAQRHMNTTSASQKSNLEHLASGSRINKAADDAAGLAISETMKSQIRSIRQASRNAQDGISMIQTAEGGMSEVGNILMRFRELSVQGASDTLGDLDRTFIDKEVQQLKAEISRITESTEFNGKNLLSGVSGSISLQVGVHNIEEQDRINLDTQKISVSLKSLGIESVSTMTRDASRDNLDKIDTAMRTLVENRSELGSMQNRLQSTVNNSAIYEENMSTANSRIRDADIATESAELAKNNILSQAGVAVLSQANQNNMLALKLLG